MFYPSLEEIKVLANSYRKLPVALELYMDFHTPIGLLSKIKARSKQYFLFESIEGGEKWARYTFLGFDPNGVFGAKDGKGYYQTKDDISYFEGNPLDYLEKLLKQYKGVKNKQLPPFTGGAIGYFGYDTIQYIENIPLENKDILQTQDIQLMFFDEVIAFDHLKQKLIIITHLDTQEGEVGTIYQQATDRLRQLVAFINTPVNPYVVQNKSVGEFESNVTKEEFIQQVNKAKAYIEAGDIFQVVLSQAFKCKLEQDLFNVYRTLRTLNPSPYMYLIQFGDLELVGASPETLIRIQDNVVMTQPIAGTRPRGVTEEEDETLMQELLRDEKELAEHNMLVDLGRNDLGRISCFNSIHLKAYQKIRKFSHVMHMTTTVEGQLNPGCSGIDAIRAILPAGTLSGAPKVRAMEIIEELEGVRRGVYGGAIGYIGYDGSLDTCIGIRTMLKKGEYAYVQAGAGIVLDSDPEAEYKETLDKASALLKALEKVREIR